jgi:hypothetical protein
LSCLEELSIEFYSSHPDWESQRLPPLVLKRSILPALEELNFKGNSEYLEELVTRIDTIRLLSFKIIFFSQIDYDCPRLAQFINCTPKLRALDQAPVQFDDRSARVQLLARSSYLEIAILSRQPRWQHLSVPQLCNSSFPPLSTVGDLFIEHQYSELDWEDDARNSTSWLEVFLPFTAVRNLYLSKEFAPDIVNDLQGLIGTRITEVLPSLRNIFVEGLQYERWGPFQENIWQFAGARRQSGHFIAISDWDEDSDEDSDMESM